MSVTNTSLVAPFWLAFGFIANGTSGSGNYDGIKILGTLESSGGAIELTGTGGDTGANNRGIYLGLDSLVKTTSALIDIIGSLPTGAGLTSLNNGLKIDRGKIESSGGNIIINATGGDGSSDQNYGMHMIGSAPIFTNGYKFHQAFLKYWHIHCCIPITRATIQSTIGYKRLRILIKSVFAI